MTTNDECEVVVASRRSYAANLKTKNAMPIASTIQIISGNNPRKRNFKRARQRRGPRGYCRGGRGRGRWHRGRHGIGHRRNRCRNRRRRRHCHRVRTVRRCRRHQGCLNSRRCRGGGGGGRRRRRNPKRRIIGSTGSSH